MNMDEKYIGVIQKWSFKGDSNHKDRHYGDQTEKSPVKRVALNEHVLEHKVKDLDREVLCDDAGKKAERCQ